MGDRDRLERLIGITGMLSLEALREMMDHDVQAICGPRHARGRERQAHR
jgi:hypothetical protein